MYPCRDKGRHCPLFLTLFVCVATLFYHTDPTIAMLNLPWFSTFYLSIRVPLGASVPAEHGAANISVFLQSQSGKLTWHNRGRASRASWRITHRRWFWRKRTDAKDRYPVQDRITWQRKPRVIFGLMPALWITFLNPKKSTGAKAEKFALWEKHYIP